MINEKELRTGNLYSTIRNQEVVVRGIDTVNKFVVVDPIEAPNDTAKVSNSIIFEDLNPIEIDSQKSDRLGFTPEKMNCLPVISDNEANFVWDEDNKQVLFKDGHNGIVGPPIRYVHQFQNMYFVLTGKELLL